MRLSAAGGAAEDVSPLQAGAFERLMEAVGPFEERPLVAVGVSGGADSLALALLLDEWLRPRGGRVVALTVDHKLRAESEREARQVARWLSARGLDHAILRWVGPHPRSDIQAAAREARYRLMAEWCRRRGVLHLAVAHHREDQAETFLLRLAHGSGLDGLAGMPSIGVTALENGWPVRLIRPLLPVPKARLVATLDKVGQPWIEDPSNQDVRHARVRMRRLLPELAACGMPAERLAATAHHLARARAAVDRETACLLARAAWLHPAGHLHIDPAALKSAAAEVSMRALARCLVTVGGGAYPPRLERLQRLHAALVGGGPFRGRTLGGCRVLWRAEALLICREAAAADAELVLRPGLRARWDGRFNVSVPSGAAGAARAVLRRLGEAGWEAAAPALREPSVAIPPPARAALPALWGAAGLLAVPHLGYVRPGNEDLRRVVIDFAARPLAAGGFTVA